MVFRFYLVLMIFAIKGAFCQQSLLVLDKDGIQSSYSLAFADEFSEDAIDENKWQTSYPWGRHLTDEKPDDESREYFILMEKTSL